MGKASREKGKRGERIPVKIAEPYEHVTVERHGYKQSGGGDDPDNLITVCGIELHAETKRRESIGDYIWEWLGGNDALLLSKNRQPVLIAMRFDDFCALVDKVVERQPRCRARGQAARRDPPEG